MLPILYRDEHLVAVDKPSGLLVHRTSQSAERENCMHLLRDQLGQWVYPVHRLDRATSGVLLFGLSAEAARAMTEVHQRKEMHKTYWAVTRGWLSESGEIDIPLRESVAKLRGHSDNDKDSKPVEALTRYKRLATTELPFEVSRHPTTRYCLVELSPITGRTHQLRRHLAHLRHPIVGDTVHGDGRHNKFFRAHFDSYRLLLAARFLKFVHPLDPNKGEVMIEAPLEKEFARVVDALRLRW